jgi:hypothetical protein
MVRSLSIVLLIALLGGCDGDDGADEVPDGPTPTSERQHSQTTTTAGDSLEDFIADRPLLQRLNDRGAEGSGVTYTEGYLFVLAHRVCEDFGPFSGADELKTYTVQFLEHGLTAAEIQAGDWTKAVAGVNSFLRLALRGNDQHLSCENTEGRAIPPLFRVSEPTTTTAPPSTTTTVQVPSTTAPPQPPATTTTAPPSPGGRYVHPTFAGYACDGSYPTVCIPTLDTWGRDIDCPDTEGNASVTDLPNDPHFRAFTISGPDPHNLQSPQGTGCANW